MREAYVTVSVGFVVALGGAHAAGALLVPCEWLWGLDILGYCRWWHAAAFALVAAATLCLRQPRAMAFAEARLSRLGRTLSARLPRVGLVKVHLALFAVSLGALLLLRAKYSGGDSHWMHETMPLFLKRAQLASATLFVLGWVGMSLGLSYVAALQGAVSVVGALSVCAVFQLFVRVFGDRGRAALFTAATLASYGLSRLLPGYIEVYGVYVLFLALYAWALARYCLGGRGLLLVLGALLALVFAHLEGLVVVPGTLVATVAVGRRRLGRVAAGWLAFGAAQLAAYPSLLGGLAEMIPPGPAESHFWSVRAEQPLLTPLHTLASARHWADFANIHAALSAVGIGLLLAALALWWRTRQTDALLLAAATHYAAFVAGTVFFHNFHHPIARDWDMFGPGALLLLLLAAALWRRLPAEKLRRAALVLLPVCACITALWLAQQAGLTGIDPPPEPRVGYVLGE